MGGGRGRSPPLLLDALDIPVAANKIAKIFAAFDLKNFIFDRVIFAFSQRLAGKSDFIGLRVNQSEHFHLHLAGTAPDKNHHKDACRRCQTKKCLTQTFRDTFFLA
jgi:hypothetical protein